MVGLELFEMTPPNTFHKQEAATWGSSHLRSRVGHTHQVILFRVCGHAPHPIAVGILGQSVSKLLSSSRLGAIEYDNVPSLREQADTRVSKCPG